MLRESNFLAGPGLGIVVGECISWNDPKLVAKMRVGSEEFEVGIRYHQAQPDGRLPLAGRNMKVAVASVLRMAE
eukprot:614882-Pelagomonas_calceolata.AAC.3